MSAVRKGSTPHSPFRTRCGPSQTFRSQGLDLLSSHFDDQHVLMPSLNFLLLHSPSYTSGLARLQRGCHFFAFLPLLVHPLLIERGCDYPAFWTEMVFCLQPCLQFGALLVVVQLLTPLEQHITESSVNGANLSIGTLGRRIRLGDVLGFQIWS